MSDLKHLKLFSHTLKRPRCLSCRVQILLCCKFDLSTCSIFASFSLLSKHLRPHFSSGVYLFYLIVFDTGRGDRTITIDNIILNGRGLKTVIKLGRAVHFSFPKHQLPNLSYATDSCLAHVSNINL